MGKNKYSIITVVKNNLQGIKRTGNSILEQIEKNYEWIIIDGASTDGTFEYFKNFCENGVAKGISESDNGIYDAMNKGIELSTGDYIIFMNAGDCFNDNCVLKNVSNFILKNFEVVDIKDLPILYGDYNLVFKDQSIILKKSRNYSYLWYGLPTSHQATFFPKTYLEKNKYDLKYEICGDYYLMAKAFMDDIKFKKINCVIAKFNVGGASLENSFQLLKESLRIQRFIIKIPIYLIIYSAIKKTVNIFGLSILNKLKSGSS